MTFSELETGSIPAPPNYLLRNPKYHLTETIRPLIEVHWGVQARTPKEVGVPTEEFGASSRTLGPGSFGVSAIGMNSPKLPKSPEEALKGL